MAVERRVRLASAGDPVDDGQWCRVVPARRVVDLRQEG
ncbi:hypothetical protein SAMN04490357_0873 [Streptomyces misionensis]|uniref:Uncharacterized protein n=1 Tax=Streptomyces misionensis TaxID=67331 RepID=A0A1H4NS91_9ACTN|nr:hypothetical protein SAMN04490357_0873 [Streptomyces misionensis]